MVFYLLLPGLYSIFASNDACRQEPVPGANSRILHVGRVRIVMILNTIHTFFFILAS